MNAEFQLAVSQTWIWEEVVDETERTGKPVLCDVGGILYWAKPGKTAQELQEDAEQYILGEIS